MRRIKAIYLAPVFLVLLIGAAAAAYYFLFKPQIEKVNAAQQAWETAQKACESEESGYQQALDERAVAAKKIYDNYFIFSQIKNQMPEIVSIKDVPGMTDEQKLAMYYKLWATGRVIKELNRWVRVFHLPNTPELVFNEATLGYEDTLPSVKIIGVPMGAQQYKVRGLTNLVNAIRRTTGVGYYPLIIALPNNTVSIKVIRNDPKLPSLAMDYSATAYCFTRGWDPYGPDAKTKVMALKDTITTKPPKIEHRTDWGVGPEAHTGATTPCPPVLFFIQKEGLKP